MGGALDLPSDPLYAVPLLELPCAFLLLPDSPARGQIRLTWPCFRLQGFLRSVLRTNSSTLLDILNISWGSLKPFVFQVSNYEQTLPPRMSNDCFAREK